MEITNPPPAPPPSPWVGLIRALPEMAANAFLAKFARPIEVWVDLRTDPESGRPFPVFSFRHHKPGLLPTAIESAWFEAYVLAYRECCNIVLDMLDPVANAQSVS